MAETFILLFNLNLMLNKKNVKIVYLEWKIFQNLLVWGQMRLEIEDLSLGSIFATIIVKLLIF